MAGPVGPLMYGIFAAAALGARTGAALRHVLIKLGTKAADTATKQGKLVKKIDMRKYASKEGKELLQQRWNLPPMPDKDMLWGYIAQYNPIVLSHPWDDASEEGKREWVAAELSPAPIDEKYTGDKHMFAVNEDGSPNLLIDDFEKYIGPWQAAGGIAILHTSAESTIKKLIDLQENI